MYLGSFALLINNSLVHYVFRDEFKLFNLFILNISGAFPNITDDIWIESSLFFPKSVLFLIGIAAWNLVKHPRAKGIVLQLATWIYLMFVSSLFFRFQQQQCDGCDDTYDAIATVAAVLMLVRNFIEISLKFRSSWYYRSRSTEYGECCQETSSILR